MSLFSSFKKALGFPDEYEDLDDLSDLEDNDDAETPTPCEMNKMCEDAECDEQHAQADDGFDTLAQSIIEVIADTDSTSGDNEVVKARISHYLTDSLSEIIKETRRRDELSWQHEREQLIQELAQLRKASGDFDAQKQEFETIKLSSTRQKRAMGERLADMEKQISTLEAEREQLQLENRCMINKLRGAQMPIIPATGVHGAEIKRLSDENSELRKELNHVKRQLVQSEKKAKEYIDKSEPTNAEIAEIESQIAKFEQIKAKKDAEINKLREHNAQLSEQNELLSQKLSKSAQSSEQLEAKINELNDTIAKNLSDNATTRAELEAEVKRLSAMIDNASERKHKNRPQASKSEERHQEKSQTKKHNRKNQKVKISAIDELMDNTDWFAAPEPGPRIKDPEVTDNFGYKETPRKSSKKNDENQLTLF